MSELPAALPAISPRPCAQREKLASRLPGVANTLHAPEAPPPPGPRQSGLRPDGAPLLTPPLVLYTRLRGAERGAGKRGQSSCEQTGAGAGAVGPVRGELGRGSGAEPSGREPVLSVSLQPQVPREAETGPLCSCSSRGETDFPHRTRTPHATWLRTQQSPQAATHGTYACLHRPLGDGESGRSALTVRGRRARGTQPLPHHTHACTRTHTCAQMHTHMASCQHCHKKHVSKVTHINPSMCIRPTPRSRAQGS